MSRILTGIRLKMLIGNKFYNTCSHTTLFRFQKVSAEFGRHFGAESWLSLDNFSEGFEGGCQLTKQEILNGDTIFRAF